MARMLNGLSVGNVNALFTIDSAMVKWRHCKLSVRGIQRHQVGLD
jgi:hypothetical protein